MSIDNTDKMESYFRNYIFIWMGQIISSLGSSVVSFVIIWWITITTQSTLMLALAGFLGVGSTLLIQPVAGVLADRKKRKLILFLTDFGQAIATVWIIVLFMAGSLEIWHIMVLLLFRGIFGGFQRPAINAIIPSMVPKDQLARMNSMSFIADAIINLASPAIAAILLAIFGLENLHLLMAIDAITFLIAVIPLLFLAIPEIFKKGEKPKTSFTEDFQEGLSYLRTSTGMLPLLLAFAVTNFFLTPTFTLLPYMVAAPYIFNSDEKLLASIFIIFQSGALTISLILSKRNPSKNLINGVSIGIFLALCGVSIVGYSGIIKSVELLYLGMLLMGIGVPYASVYSNTIWQKSVPHELQGRVMSVRITISSLVSPFSILMVGFVSENINPSYLFFAAGLLGITFYALSWLKTDMRFIESGLTITKTEEPKDGMISSMS